MLDVAGSIVGLKHAVNTFTEVVDDALSNIKTDIGLHLPSLDAGMYDDPQGTLSEVAQIGYSMIEIGAYHAGKVYNMTPEEFKALADKSGLKITAAHLNHLYEMVDGEADGIAGNSADAEAAKRAARWVAMAKGAEVTEVADKGEEANKIEGADELEEVAYKEGEADKGEEASKLEEVADKGEEADNKAEAATKEIEPNKGEEAATEMVATEEESENTESTPNPNDEWWSKALDIHRDLGCKYIIMSRLPDYPTDEVVARYAKYFNRIGDMAAERGMQFCYHPRQQEMKVVDGKSAFEAIVANTDPEKVRFEIDTLEAKEADVDVSDLLKRLSKRVTLLHIHDYGVVGESTAIDFEKIIAQAIRTGVKDIFVEVRNFSLPPMNCVERSYYNVESLPSISF